MHLVVFQNDKAPVVKPFYKNNGLRIEDTDTEQQAIDYVTEEFLLKDRKRAIIYKENGYGGYGYHGF